MESILDHYASDSLSRQYILGSRTGKRQHQLQLIQTEATIKPHRHLPQPGKEGFRSPHTQRGILKGGFAEIEEFESEAIGSAHGRYPLFLEGLRLQSGRLNVAPVGRDIVRF